MFKLRNELKRILIPLAVIIVIVILILIWGDKKEEHTDLKRLDNHNSERAQVQSYAISAIPNIDKEDMVIGSTKAALPIIVYEDYSNPFSARLADILDQVRQNNKGVAIVVRPYVSKSSILSEKMALAVICANKKWEKMRSLVFSQLEKNQLLLSKLGDYAQEVGLNRKSFLACLASPQKQGEINNMMKSAKGYAVMGTPTMFLGDEMIIGVRPYNDYVDSNGDKIEGLETVVYKKLEH